MGSMKVYDYNYQIETFDAEGNMIERIGEMNHFAVAKAAYEAAVANYAWSNVKLRNCARIVETATTGGYDTETKMIPVLARSN